MKKLFLSTALLMVFGLAISSVHAQTTNLPGAATSSVTVPVTDTSCTSTNTCLLTVYRIAGTCPSILAASAGWTVLGTIAVPSATQYLDNTVSPTTQYSYDVEAAPTANTAANSAPSNCATITTPFHPAAPVLGALSAS
jgi:hypothetical protein